MINLICKNLRKEEIYVQISDCFEQLEKITNDAFEKIDGKLSSMNFEIIQIEKRREFIKSKIEKIKENKNRAIKIISPLDYPIEKVKEKINYEPVFNFDTNFEHETKKNNIEQKFELFHVDDLNEKLNFCDLDLFLKAGDENLNVNFLKFQNKNDLQIPWSKIKSISSLIVFNSSETAYIKTDQDSSIVDFKVLKTKKLEDETDYDSFNFGPPPKSMIENNKMKDHEKNLFNYDQQEAPQILDDFPTDLPDLGAVADDNYFNENEEIIFSFFDSKKTDGLEENKNKSPNLIKIFSTEDKINLSENQENNQVENKKNNEVEDSKIAFTPPPPPPLPTMNISEVIIEKSKEIPAINPLMQIDNSRSSLLDAIRKAGGKPDKSKVTIKEKKLEEKKNRKEAVSTDLMSDLKKHLMSRRQGMVGKGNDLKTNQPEKKSSNSSSFNKVFDSMNRMLPSPSHSSGSSGEDSNDEDWVNS